MNGLDLSYANELTLEDLQTLKKEHNLEFIILRLGYSATLDKKVKYYLQLCEKLDIPVGFYHFSYAYDEASALREVEFIRKNVKLFEPASHFPLFLDFEYDSEKYFTKKTGRKFTEEDYKLIYNTYLYHTDFDIGIYCNLDYLRRFKFLLNRNNIWLAGSQKLNNDIMMRQEQIVYKGKEIDFNILYDKDTIADIINDKYSGWRFRFNKWKYFTNGEFLTGWHMFNWKTYYFDENGIMATGLQTINDKLYYFSDNGVMCRTSFDGDLVER